MKPKMFLIAQNVNIYTGDGRHQFARTGELGFHHLKKAGATGLILGHSEVKDSPEVVNKKWKTALDYGFLNNIVLVGEDWEDLEKGWDKSSEEEKEGMKEKLKNKFLIMLESIKKEIIEKTVFGYEPSWGVRGSGKEGVLPPQPQQIESMCLFLREIISNLRFAIGEKYGKNILKAIRVIYGGSSSPERAEEIMPLENVDGLILGSAGATSDWVQKIGKSIERAMKNKIDAHYRSRPILNRNLFKFRYSKKTERKGVLALNWKAYELKEGYPDFLRIVEGLDGKFLEVYLAPSATDLKELKAL